MKTAAALALALVLASPDAHAVTVAIGGPASVLYDSARDACAPIDVPDINPRAYRDAAGRVVMYALHFINRPLRGPDLTHVKIDCKVALGSAFDPVPSHYDDRRYIAATWTQDGTHVDALVHHEYHADQHGTCSVTDSLGCWFNTVLAFHSSDGGATFTPARPLVVASAPFKQDVEQGRHRGFFNPSNIVADGGADYALISTTGWDGQAPGNCLFRSTNPAESGSWRAFDGTAFTVRYADPYTSTARPRPCAIVGPFLFPVGSIVRRTKGGTWIAVFQAAPGGVFPVEGFYYATARDLLHWSEPHLLLPGRTPYSDLCKVGASIIAYPAMLDPDSPSRNFDTVGEHPLLFYMVSGVDGCQTTRRLLVYRSLSLHDDAPMQAAPPRRH